MLVLHTSDWHLGRLLHGASLLDEQAQALAVMVDVVADRGVELVVVAGDLYDRAVPPAEAVALFDRTMTAFVDAGAKVVAISGNHDSGTRVGVGDQLLVRAGLTIRGDVRRAAEPVLVEPRAGGAPVAVYPVPYLEPALAAHVAAADELGARLGFPIEPADHGEAVAAAAGRRRFTQADALGWALERAERHRAGHVGPSLVVAHAFVAGGQGCDSERELAVGGSDAVAPSLFRAFDYVALGHLHGAQAFAGGRIAYSGTPLAYSFSEEHHTKSVRLVELGPGGVDDVEVITLGVGRPLATITGTLEGLLADPSLHEAQKARVRAVLTDPVLPLGAMARLRSRFPHTAELRHQPVGRAGEVRVGPGRDEVREADPAALARRFLAEQWGTEPDEGDEALLALATASAAVDADAVGVP